LSEILIDARGHRCPVPTLRLRRAWDAAPGGSVLRLLADDPMARIDVPHFADQIGLEIVSLATDSGVVTVVLRKP
jgi:tRNA 2-thiouridine synthesizing protein A